MRNAPTKIEDESAMPGPATSSGKTSIPAPTVFPVIINDVDNTGSSEDSTKVESRTRLFVGESHSSAIETAERLSILRLLVSSFVLAGCIFSSTSCAETNDPDTPVLLFIAK